MTGPELFVELIVGQLDYAADKMLHWLKPGPGGSEQREQYAVWWAKAAAHCANQLLDLSEKGECAR